MMHTVMWNLIQRTAPICLLSQLSTQTSKTRPNKRVRPIGEPEKTSQRRPRLRRRKHCVRRCSSAHCDFQAICSLSEDVGPMTVDTFCSSQGWVNPPFARGLLYFSNSYSAFAYNHYLTLVRSFLLELGLVFPAL